MALAVGSENTVLAPDSATKRGALITIRAHGRTGG